MNSVKNSKQYSRIHDSRHLNLGKVGKPRQNSHMKFMGSTQQYVMNDFLKSTGGMEVGTNN